MLKLISVLVLVVAVFSPGCSTTKDAVRNGKSDVVDCAKKEAIERAAEFAPALELLLQRSTTDDGKLDLPTLETATESLSDLGWCAVEKTFARAFVAATSALQSGSPQSSAHGASPAALLHGLAELRARQRAGKQYVNVTAGE